MCVVCDVSVCLYSYTYKTAVLNHNNISDLYCMFGQISTASEQKSLC